MSQLNFSLGDKAFYHASVLIIELRKIHFLYTSKYEKKCQSSFFLLLIMNVHLYKRSQNVDVLSKTSYLFIVNVTRIVTIPVKMLAEITSGFTISDQISLVSNLLSCYRWREGQ